MISPRNKLGLVVILGVIILVLVPMYFIIANNNPGNESNFELCTEAVSQLGCYPGTPIPILNWSVDETGSRQIAYRVQIDDNSNFLSLAIDTANVASVDKFYQVAGGLSFNTLYYWRVRIQDNVGSYSDWEAVDSFTTAPSCNLPPTIPTILVTSPDSATYCSNARHLFSWVYFDIEDDDQSKFQIQVDDDIGFGSSVDITWDSFGPSGSWNNQTINVVSSPGVGQLGYGTHYYWRVKVWDDQGGDSGWVSGPEFDTASHQYPTISFNWSPQSIGLGENVQFIDNSIVYGGAAKSAWSWTFENGNPLSSGIADPIVQFTLGGSKAVTLAVTDTNSFSCQDSNAVDVGWTLPNWREILPW